MLYKYILYRVISIVYIKKGVNKRGGYHVRKIRS
jgi:hypothetical protein